MKTIAIARCVGCNCTDLQACFDDVTGCACHWLVVNRATGTGVCSCCAEHVPAWQASNAAASDSGARTANSAT
jgi:hypothetical protein